MQEVGPGLTDRLVLDRLKELGPESSDEESEDRSELERSATASPAVSEPQRQQCLLCSPPLDFKTMKARAVHIKIHHSGVTTASYRYPLQQINAGLLDEPELLAPAPAQAPRRPKEETQLPDLYQDIHTICPGIILLPLLNHLL